MSFLLLSLLVPTSFFVCQAINQARHKKDKANAQLEKQKFRNAVILSILNGSFAIFSPIITENYKHNDNINKPSEIKTISQKDTKTLSISKNSIINSKSAEISRTM
jgi:hypothetical protein